MKRKRIRSTDEGLEETGKKREIKKIILLGRAARMGRGEGGLEDMIWRALKRAEESPTEPFRQKWPENRS